MKKHQSIRNLLAAAATAALPATIALAQSAATVTTSGTGTAQGSGGSLAVTRVAGPHGSGGGAAIVAGGGAGQDSSHVVTVITNKDDATNKCIELRIENGAMTVKCDGKEIPDDQIKREEGQIIILDENGDVLQKLGVGSFGHNLGGMTGWASADPYAQALAGQSLFAAQEADAPKLMLGIHMVEPGPALGKHLHINPEECLMISGVYKGLPADQAGIQQYDIVVKIDGAAPADRETLRKVLDERDDGQSVTLSIIHEGKNKDVVVNLVKFDAEALASSELMGDYGDNVMIRTLTSTDPLGGGRLFSGNGQWVFTQPQQWSMDEDQFKMLKRLQGLPAATKDSDDRLDRLNERLATLERLLQELVEKKSNKP